jgi:hypothetical protein
MIMKPIMAIARIVIIAIVTIFLVLDNSLAGTY